MTGVVVSLSVRDKLFQRDAKVPSIEVKMVLTVRACNNNEGKSFSEDQ